MGRAISATKTLNEKSNRIYKFDNVKFIAILMVVVGHAINMMIMEDSEDYLEKSLFLIIYSFHMPLFIFISGLFTKPMTKETKFPKQKVISFILIGIVLRMMFQFFRMMIGVPFYYSMFDIYDTFAWYMWAMAIWLIILWVFREYNIKYILLLSVFIGCMAGYDRFMNDDFALLRIFILLPFFIVGYMITPEQLLDFLSHRWMKIVSAVILITVCVLFIVNTDIYNVLRPMFTARNHYTSIDEYVPYNHAFLIRILCYVLSSLIGLSIICLTPNIRIPVISKAGTKTLQIYFWHQFFLTVIEAIGLYTVIETEFSGTLASSTLVLAGIVITFVCTLPIFSFPTQQLLRFGGEKIAKHKNKHSR